MEKVSNHHSQISNFIFIALLISQLPVVFCFQIYGLQCKEAVQVVQTNPEEGGKEKR
jgi:hypothetical protein